MPAPSLADRLQVPPPVREMVRACAEAGGRALLVGGCVRDALRGEPTVDIDIEVHGLAPDDLRTLLRRFGRVDEVGRSFGVFKVRVGRDPVDVSVPRRDRKVGAGHRGILAEADPHLGPVEAARRRDLTVNAIAWDPLTDELIDPFDGRGDLDRGLLRAVDEDTFAEDPLRALRVVQFAGRFQARVDPALVALCRRMPLGELPGERVRGEVEKWLLRSPRPSVGWQVALDGDIWARVLPAWDKPCPPSLDRLAAAAIEHPPRRLALLLACTAPPAPLADVLDRLGMHSWLGYDVRGQALALATAQQAPTVVAPAEGGSPRHGWMAPLPPAPEAPTATRARHLAERVEVELFAALTDDAVLGAAAADLGIGRTPLLPLVTGRDLLALGMPPGRAVGQLLTAIRRAQLDGHLSSPDAALAWARAAIR